MESNNICINAWLSKGEHTRTLSYCSLCYKLTRSAITLLSPASHLPGNAGGRKGADGGSDGGVDGHWSLVQCLPLLGQEGAVRTLQPLLGVLAVHHQTLGQGQTKSIVVFLRPPSTLHSKDIHCTAT